MTSTATVAGRFVRRTSLGDDEYRVNFRQIDCDVLDTLTSDEASAVTPSMSKIYIRLLRAPISCWEGEGILRFVGENREEKALTAWEQLAELTGVANSTLSKALTWMHKTGIIGYHARKNGVGIRIFINRARSSIRTRSQKNLRLVHAPLDKSPAPSDGISFKEGISEEVLDKGINPHAHPRAAGTIVFAEAASPSDAQRLSPKQNTAHDVIAPSAQIDLGQVVRMVKLEMQPVIASICDDAITNACRKEATLNREWLESAGIPKAVRVAQRETFDLLRSQGMTLKRTSNSADVGSNRQISERGEKVVSEASKIAAFLADTVDMICRAAAGDAASEKPVMRAALRAVEEELGDLRNRIALDDGAIPVDLEDIESRLAAAEGVIVEALWRSTDPDELGRMQEAATVNLKRYKSTMEPGVYGDTLRRYVITQLRELHGIPCLSLFYLAPTTS